MKQRMLNKIRRIPVVDRIRLVQCILDTIADDETQLGLTRRQKSALGKRIAARRKRATRPARRRKKS
ncbi:MAG: hypothetical protein NTW87_10155 [Planctomycetota bacterium]|nr:hypothetical protein [Planctomycetota bacterium]